MQTHWKHTLNTTNHKKLSHTTITNIQANTSGPPSGKLLRSFRNPTCSSKSQLNKSVPYSSLKDTLVQGVLTLRHIRHRLYDIRCTIYYILCLHKGNINGLWLFYVMFDVPKKIIFEFPKKIIKTTWYYMKKAAIWSYYYISKKLLVWFLFFLICLSKS